MGEIPDSYTLPIDVDGCLGVACPAHAPPLFFPARAKGSAAFAGNRCPTGLPHQLARFHPIPSGTWGFFFQTWQGMS
jgi:hypothetical protein